ncbi:hypothetical protein BJV74DRAFT_887690 [Russula compacta]|nr:hypothetical protein BJV74DRAFT_887690 [Russula compacta]
MIITSSFAWHAVKATLGYNYACQTAVLEVPTPSHAFSLRPNAKGYRGHQSADAPDSEVEPSSSSIGANQEDIVITDEREDESNAGNPSPATSHELMAGHTTPPPPQDLREQRPENLHRRGIMSSQYDKHDQSQGGGGNVHAEAPPGAGEVHL